jgi:hypothetical protein
MDGKAMDLVDSSLAKSCSRSEALRCIQIGLLCVQDNPNYRPLMSPVVTMLESLHHSQSQNSLCISHAQETNEQQRKILVALRIA